MESSRVALALLCALAFLFHASQAQDSTQEYIDTHNSARGELRLDNLTWDGMLASFAQDYANNRTEDCTLIHSNSPYGENLFVGTGGYTATEVVKAWVAEKQYYDYDSNSCASGQMCGHYTQVVWRNSLYVGCACAMCNNGSMFVSCNYNPAGNVIGQRPY